MRGCGSASSARGKESDGPYLASYGGCGDQIRFKGQKPGKRGIWLNSIWDEKIIGYRKIQKGNVGRTLTIRGGLKRLE